MIGSFLARAVVGYVLVPAYFQREIYSPYDYMGAKLGNGVRRATTLLFSLGGVLGQSARVYLTALVLEVLIAPELAWLESQTGLTPLAGAVFLIGVLAIAWTWMGGIAAVIWTDAFLFLLFLIGIGVSLYSVSAGVPGGLSVALREGLEAGKFQFFDFDWKPTKAYTFWVACLAAPWGMIGQYGTDQLLAQRLFCCSSPRAARRAILWSTLSIGVTFLVAVLGVGLWAYYRANPLAGDLAALVAEKPDKVFPVFISHSIPSGLRGIVIAGVFAAAISSLDSILAALSQTTVSLLGPKAGEGRRPLLWSRLCVFVWGVLLCLATLGMAWVSRHYDSVLDLALAMAGYTTGALLAAFFLAFLPVRTDGSGFLWSAPLSVAGVFALVWHAPWAQWTTVAFGAGLMLSWGVWRARPDLRAGVSRASVLTQSLVLAVGIALVIGLSAKGTFAGGGVVAWPWYIPCGSSIAFVFALALDRRAS